jgi:N-acyl-L-homoserine lactone synthetase
LLDVFRAKARVHDLLKWDLPVCDNAYELDRFDEPGAVYLIVSAADGSHRASARLLPTTRLTFSAPFSLTYAPTRRPRGPPFVRSPDFVWNEICAHKTVGGRETNLSPHWPTMT